DVIKTIDNVADTELPQGMDYLWTELTYLQIQVGNTAIVVFAVAVLLVFLVVPMCLLCSVVGVAMAKMDINIFVQIGFVVLVGLASKNAILIVEFAKEKSAHGATPVDGTLQACRLRLRPILMTSF